MKTQLNELIERWEARARIVDRLALTASNAGDYAEDRRLKTKSEMFRSLAAELNREMIDAAANPFTQDFAHKLTHCQKCGEFRGHGHECKLDEIKPCHPENSR